MKNKKTFGWLLVVLLFTGIYAQNRVKQAPGNLTTLTAKWNWVKAQNPPDSYYVGYTIKRLMGENSRMGSWYDDDTITLHELIRGEQSPTRKSTKSAAKYAQEILNREKTKQRKTRKVWRELCFLFRYEKGLKKIRFLTMDSQIKMKQWPVYWLGEVNQKESLAFIIRTFNQSKAENLQKSLVAGASMHGNETGVFPFLEGVIRGDYSLKVRSSAVFWVGEIDTPKTVNLLKGLVGGNSELKIKKQAVFSLYRVKLPEAEDALIYYARSGDSIKLRKQAIFWLGQRAAKKIAGILGDLAQNDSSSEIQNSAVFALYQLPKGQGIPKLIKIAKTHPKLRVRKKALFWLGQSGDDRALDTIVDILKSKK